MTFYVLLFVFSVFIASVSQTILKTSAEKKYDSRLQEYLNPKVIIAYGMFFLCSLITTSARESLSTPRIQTVGRPEKTIVPVIYFSSETR